MLFQEIVGLFIVISVGFFLPASLMHRGRLGPAIKPLVLPAVKVGLAVLVLAAILGYGYWAKQRTPPDFTPLVVLFPVALALLASTIYLAWQLFRDWSRRHPAS